MDRDAADVEPPRPVLAAVAGEDRGRLRDGAQLAKRRPRRTRGHGVATSCVAQAEVLEHRVAVRPRRRRVEHRGGELLLAEAELGGRARQPVAAQAGVDVGGHLRRPRAARRRTGSRRRRARRGAPCPGTGGRSRGGSRGRRRCTGGSSPPWPWRGPRARAPPRARAGSRVLDAVRAVQDRGGGGARERHGEAVDRLAALGARRAASRRSPRGWRSRRRCPSAASRGSERRT